MELTKRYQCLLILADQAWYVPWHCLTCTNVRPLNLIAGQIESKNLLETALGRPQISCTREESSILLECK